MRPNCVMYNVYIYTYDIAQIDLHNTKFNFFMFFNGLKNSDFSI